MSATGVQLTLLEGQLPPAPANADGIFAVIGTSLFLQANAVAFLTDPDSVASICGPGSLGEVAGQILTKGAAGVYVVSGNRTEQATVSPFSMGVGPITYSRTGMPALVATALMGMPNASLGANGVGQPLSASPANAGTGSVFFAPGSTPNLGSTNATISVVVTTAGPLGTAVCTITIGNNSAQTGQPMTSAVWKDATNNSGIWLDFSLPVGGVFKVGDSFTAAAMPNDGYNVQLNVQSVNAQGLAYITSSYDGGNTLLGPNPYYVGCAITETGATQPVLTIGGTAPAANSGLVYFNCIQAGTALGAAGAPGAQTNPSTGAMNASGGGSYASALVYTPISTTPGVAGAITATLTVTGTGTALGTVTGGGSTGQPFPTAITSDTGGSASSTVYTISSGSFSVTPTAGEVAVDNNGVGYLITGANTTTITVSGGLLNHSTITGMTVYPVGGTASATLTLVDSVGGTRVYTFVAAPASSGLAASGNGLPATFTESTSGVVFHFSSSVHNFANGQSYTIVIQPPAIFNVSVNGAVYGGGSPTAVYINSAGHPSASNGTALNPQIPGVANPTLTFAHTSTDIYSYSALAPSQTTTFSFYLYPAITIQPAESNGTLLGLNLALGFGTYLAGDQLNFSTVAPSVGTTDVEAANTALQAVNANYSMLHVAASFNTVLSGVTPWAQLATLAASLQSMQTAFSQNPTWTLVPFFLYGPDNADLVAGSELADYETAFQNVVCNIGSICASADVITSAVTQRKNTVSNGYAISPRLASTAVQIDPGWVALGGLPNDNSTTTAQADAQQFNTARAMASTYYARTAGVYVVTGVSLESPTGDYTLVALQRVIAKVYNASYTALLPYVNGNVPTVPGTGTLDPTFAGAMAKNVANQINAVCPGNYQAGPFVQPSLTQNVLQTRVLPVKISVLPFAYLQDIQAAIGFTMNLPTTG